MFRTTLPAGLLCLLAASAGFTAAPPPKPLGPAALSRLIEQLGSRDYRLREQAERTLSAQGTLALPVLRKALGHRDAEVRRRVMRLLPGLEHAALVAPKRFSLVIDKKPLNTAITELAKASGYKVMLNGGFVPPPPPGGGGKAASGETTFSWTFVNVTFWEAIDRMCRDASLLVQQSWGDDTIRLQSGSGYAPHVGRDGAFRYTASNFQMYRSVDLTAIHPGGANPNNRTENLTFSFNLFAEPRLPFLGMGEIRLDAAYDNERNSLLVKHDAMEGPFGGQLGGRFMGRRYYGGGYKQLTMQASVNLQRLSEKATMMKVLKGVVPVTLLVEQKPIVISDKILSAKGTKKKAGDLEFHIENIQKMPNNQFQIKFSVTNKGKTTGDYMWMNTLYQRIELQDEKGNKFQNWGSSWGGSGGNNVQLTLTYSNPGSKAQPAKFVYQHWVTKQHDIPFEFRNIPLP